MARFLLVVAAADRDRANLDALAHDPEGGARTFTVGLSPTGEAPATHYWCSVQVNDPLVADAIRAKVPEYPGSRLVEYDLRDDPLRPHAVLAELGLRPVRSA